MSSHVEDAGGRVYRVVFGIAEHRHAVVLEREVKTHPRFQIDGVASNAIMTVDLARGMQPDVVVISDMSPGTPGRAVLGDLAASVPKALVIITAGSGLPELQARPEVAHAVGELDAEALHAALDSTAAFLDAPAPKFDERRTQAERRIQQDWTKVFAERRVAPRRVTDTSGGSA